MVTFFVLRRLGYRPDSVKKWPTSIPVIVFSPCVFGPCNPIYVLLRSFETNSQQFYPHRRRNSSQVSPLYSETLYNRFGTSQSGSLDQLFSQVNLPAPQGTKVWGSTYPQCMFPLVTHQSMSTLHLSVTVYGRTSWICSPQFRSHSKLLSWFP